jgi:hypothetical protein
MAGVVKNAKRTRCAIYFRISSVGQEDNSSLDIQKVSNRAYAVDGGVRASRNGERASTDEALGTVDDVNGEMMRRLLYLETDRSPVASQERARVIAEPRTVQGFRYLLRRTIAPAANE